MARKSVFMMILALVLAVSLTGFAQAGAILPGAFNTNSLPGNDDGSTGLVPIGFSINFFGTNSTDLYINNNGNVTLDSPNPTFTPFQLTGNIGTRIIAPFFADVDTRLGNIVTYGPGTFAGRNAFGVNWIDVGYFSQHTDKLNSFQLILVDRSDRVTGDFDIVFNYDKVQWETGDASGGVQGLGGASARAGYSDGTGTPGSNNELPGSGVNGAFLDGGSLALKSLSNINVPGRYVFEVKNGLPPVKIKVVPPILLLLLMGDGDSDSRF